MFNGDHLILDRPGFTLKSRLDRILHGSCRRPHHPSADGLVRVDEELQKAERLEDVPSLLLMTGDQVYADDVAGPMLHAIQCVIHQLGLYQETLDGASLKHSRELTSVANAYYHRDELLPESEFNEDLTEGSPDRAMASSCSSYSWSLSSPAK